MISICSKCCEIRGVEPDAGQQKAKCDFCGAPSLCSSTTIDKLPAPEFMFSEKGYFHSRDLATLLAMIKGRKATVGAWIKSIQAEISKPMADVRISDKVYEFEVLIAEALKRKSLDRIKKDLLKIGKFIGSVRDKGVRQSRIVVMQNLMAELTGLEEKEKQLSILYKFSVDQILIRELQIMLGEAKFDRAYENAKRIYLEKNSKGVRK